LTVPAPVVTVATTRDERCPVTPRDRSRYPTVSPYLLYEDVAAALGWLAEAFGFEERLRLTTEDGTVTHAEMAVGPDGMLMLGHPGPDHRDPRTTGVATALAYVMVDDVDAHAERARAAGASIVREPQDEAYGHRRYDVTDLAGHTWSFAEHQRDVPPEAWGATTAP
jgi:PhnB protein